LLLRGIPADIVFTDPPYNVRVAGHVSQRADAREFAMASGELSSEEFVDFQQTISAHIAANVANGAVVYICMDWRHLDDLSAATRRYFGKPKNMIVWVKTKRWARKLLSLPTRTYRGVCGRHGGTDQ
jgi:DNA modification methylase